MLSHTGVGHLSLVVIKDTGRIYVVPLGSPLLIYDVLKDGLRGTASAYIT